MRLSLPVFELFRVCVVTGFRYVLLTPRSCARLRRFRQTQQVSKQAIRAGNSGGQLAKPRVGRVDVMAATDARIALAAALRRFARIVRFEERRVARVEGGEVVEVALLHPALPVCGGD